MKLKSAIVIILIFIKQAAFPQHAPKDNSSCQFEKLIYIDTTNLLKIDRVRILLNNHNFKSFQNINFNDLDTYWLYIKLDSGGTYNFRVLQFLKPFSHIELYPFPFNRATEFSGQLISARIKKLEGNNIVLHPDKNEFLVKIRNALSAKASLNDITIINGSEYFRKQQNKDIVQGIVQGILWLMLIYNLFFFVYTRKPVYFHYVFYVLFNSVFLLYCFNYTEQFLFPEMPHLNFTFSVLQLVGMFFYIMFIRIILVENCPKYAKWLASRLFGLYCYFVLIVHTFIGLIAYYNFELFARYYAFINLFHGLTAFATFVYLYRRESVIGKYIIWGSIIMIAGGYITILTDLHHLPSNHYPYEIGLVIEILIFSYVLNRLHRTYENEGYKADLQNQQLNNMIEYRDRELVSNAMLLVKNNEANNKLLNNLKNLVSLINRQDDKIVPTINSIITDYETQVNNNFWNEFEFRFKNVHKDFYDKLLEISPDLTPNEIKLAAFLRLNLSSKEISLITGQSIEGIKMGRYRLRKKLGIKDTENMITFLINL